MKKKERFAGGFSLKIFPYRLINGFFNAIFLNTKSLERMKKKRKKTVDFQINKKKNCLRNETCEKQK